MFISLSKTIGKVGGFRIGIGKRVTAKNAWWLCLIICFVAVLQLTWYMCILAFWLMYAMFYGIWWCCKKIIQGIAHALGKGTGTAKDEALDRLQSNTYANVNSETNIVEPIAPDQKQNFCPKCGSELVEGNAFCTKCGTKISM